MISLKLEEVMIYFIDMICN